MTVIIGSFRCESFVAGTDYPAGRGLDVRQKSDTTSPWPTVPLRYGDSRSQIATVPLGRRALRTRAISGVISAEQHVDDGQRHESQPQGQAFAQCLGNDAEFMAVQTTSTRAIML
jgi:hypothetical protein